MKTALIFFRDVLAPFDADIISQAVLAFESGGIKVDSTMVLSDADDLGFIRSFDDFKDTADNLIIVDNGKTSFDLREIIANKLDAPLVENENALSFVRAFNTSFNTDYPETLALMPIDSILIPNVRGAYQGYMAEQGDFSLIVLPSNKEQLSVMCLKYVLPYFENKYDIHFEKITLKYFGDTLKLKEVLSSAKENYGSGMDFFLQSNYGDTTVKLVFRDNADKKNTADTVRYIVSSLIDNIYAEFDTSLGERLFDLLKLREKKLSTAESFTAGRVVSSVIAISGASYFVNEGVVSYSNLSKEKRLGVKKSDIDSVGAVSKEVAYSMAAGLLSTGDCDIAISTTGIAGPKSDDSKKNVGLCYIAVGMKDGIHIYKYNFSGDREQVTETAKNTALFLAIQRLKKL